MSISSPTEIQRATISEILAGRDVIGGAKTGSGKTAAFALPILQKLSEDPYGVFGLVLTPTRELAFQISEQFEVLGKGINLKVCVCVGGMDMMHQALQLARRPHIVIATPGRLADHMLSSANTNHFKRLRFLVMDEADRLLDPTFKPDLDTIFENINKKRQTLLYTATMTEDILKMKTAEDGLVKNPHIYECDTRISTVSTLTQNYVFLPSYVREAYLVHLLQSEELKGKSTIIFVGRCQTAETIRSMLVELGIRCTGLHSMMNQNERLNSLGKFRSSVVPILIATDVGSRGLDIPTVQLVLNYNLPRDPTDYIHRVGRTARAGRGGRAISLVTEKDISLVHDIEARVNKQLEEYKVSETKVLEILNDVSAAKRMANMYLHDNNFGSKQEVRKLKQKALRDSEKKRNRSSRKEKSKKIRTN
ncbi:putative RNA helicase [Basidiobolus ranarum]|uniref:RNA helicase n=1 Tax=Basidiobolus ranarum TaxID=34480 RepID=A0ABR2WYG6_9FUNG